MPLANLLLLASTRQRMPDVLQLARPAEISMQGFLGQRVGRNVVNRLLVVDEGELLEGFRHRPGKQAWIGEHVGKFLHAACLAYQATGNSDLRAKIQRVASGLMAKQEQDGYLGTYLVADRWQLKPGSDWDVWTHKYCLIGLLAYYQTFNDSRALAACRRIGDLLARTFGPGKKSILSAGTHMGMAATSVLEPTVLLYRQTGEVRYLEFAKYIVRSWSEPGGPDILNGLLAGKGVDRIANGKAYEMLSNLVGLCELARATGETRYVTAAENAWRDIVRRHRYITGAASSFEHFQRGPRLADSESDNVGETCVTVTWMQLNAELLQITGDAKYGDEIERSAMNHLAGAQRPDGAAWCYYTPLEGHKPYGNAINCCLSSGPRGVAMLPTFAYLRRGSREIDVNLFETSRFRTKVDGIPIEIRQSYSWQNPSLMTLTVGSPSPVKLRLAVRAPSWVDVIQAEGASKANGWLRLPERTYRPGQQVRFQLNLGPRLVDGGAAEPGRAALTWGPFVMAYDEHQNADGLRPGAAALLHSMRFDRHRLPGTNDMVLDTQLTIGATKAARFQMIPFADAGTRGGFLQVWLPNRPPDAASAVMAFARPSRSRMGNVFGSIADGNPSSFVVTFDETAAEEDWYALEWRQPVEIRRVSFRHGKSFHDGGWFDASVGAPRVEVRRAANGPWEAVGRLEGYPRTSSTSDAGLIPGQVFRCALSAPQTVYGVRVVGKPAGGDNPKQAFSSCAELLAE